MSNIQVSHILVQYEYEANDLVLALEKRKCFEDLARRYSKCTSAGAGGDLGVIVRGRTVEEFEEVAFALNVDEISKPVRTRFGYHLIKRTL